MNRDTRGVSEVLGFILVFSLVLASIAIVSTVGLDQISNVRDVEQMNNAEEAFDLLATNLDDIARRGAPSRSTELQLATGQLALSDTVSVRFELVDHTDTTVFDQSYDVRPIRYRGSADERAVVYAGGAIFRTYAGSGTIVREPSMIASDGRVSIPFIHTRSTARESRGGGTARLRASHAQTVVLAADTDASYGEVFMNVTSPRAQLWHETLDAHDEFECELDESGPGDRAWCRVENPDRVHIAMVQVDLSINN